MCKVVDVIHVVVIKCCKWTKICGSFSLSNVRGHNLPSFFTSEVNLAQLS